MDITKSVQFSCLVISDSLRPHGLQHARLTCPSPTPGGLLTIMSIKSVMPSNHLIFCHPLLLLLSIFPSIRVFSNELVLCIRWPKYWSFSFRISPSSEYSGLTLWDPMDYTVHGILQASIPEWVAFSFSRGSSQPGDQTLVSCIAGGFFTS